MGHDFSLEGTLHIANPDTELLLQEVFVPYVLITMACVFFVTALAYSCDIFLSGRRLWTEMHALIGATILLKAVVLLLWYIDCLQVAKTGVNNIVGQVMWQVLDKAQDILELLLLLFSSLGWKFLRPHLNPAEKRFAGGIVMVSSYLGLLEIVCTSQASCNSHMLSRYILHSLVYLVIIVAMNFNLQLIGAQIHEAPATIEAGKLYMKFKAYRSFRWTVLAFVIAPTLEMLLKLTVLPWDAAWLYILLQQLRTLVIYALLIVAFFRLPHPSPLRVFELATDGAHSDGEREGDDWDELRMSVLADPDPPPLPPPPQSSMPPRRQSSESMRQELLGSVEVIRGFPT